MAESGNIQFPAAKSAYTDSRPATPIEPNGRIVKISPDLHRNTQEERRPLRLRGTVTETHTDGSVRITTPRGDIDVRLQKSDTPLREGDQVEIEIPPQTPERGEQKDIIIRPLSPEGPPRQGITVQTEYQTPESPPPTPRALETPIDLDVPLPASSGTAPPPAVPLTYTYPHPAPPPLHPALPPEGTLLKLTPLPLFHTQQSPAPLTSLLQLQTPFVTPAPLPVLHPVLLEKPQQPLLLAPVLSAPAPLLSPEALLSVPKPTGAPDTPDVSAPLSLSAPAFAQDFPAEAFVFPHPQSVLQTRPPAPNNMIEHSLEALFLLQDTQSRPIFSNLPLAPVSVPLGAPLLFPQTGIPAISKPPPLSASLILRLESIDPPEVQLFPADPSALPESVILKNKNASATLARVTLQTEQKLPVLSLLSPSSGGREILFALHYPSGDFLPQSLLTLTPVTQNPASQPLSPSGLSQPAIPAPSFSSLFLPQMSWPLMEDLFQTLEQSAPQSAQAFINILPSPAQAPQMAPALLFFLSALKGGDLFQWIGDKTTDLLRREGRTSLLGRLGQEAQTLSRIAVEPLAQEWRALHIPLYYQGDFQKIALFYKNGHGAEGPDGQMGAHSTRFVFELKLSAMGQVQLDGLYRPVSEKGKRLDLAIRTEHFFSQATQAEMRRVFARALRETGITGELSFQNQSHWVTVQPLHTSALGVEA